MFVFSKIANNALGGILMQENIKKWRNKKGKSQEDLADYMKVSVPTVSRWETGANAISLERLQHIADFIGVTVPQLLSDQNDIDRFIEINNIAKSMDKTSYKTWIKIGELMIKAEYFT